MSLWRRIVSALNAGLTGAVRDWQGATLPLQETGWDHYNQRLIRYWLSEAYHNNIIYDQINALSLNIKATKKLYHSMRGIYNPVARQNNIYVSKVYPGALDMDGLLTGAIPIMTDNEAVYDALKNLFLWSSWGSQKNLYVRYGAKFGDAFIKVVDDRMQRKVRLEVLDPRKVKHMVVDSSGAIQELWIEYERLDESAVLVTPNGTISNEHETFTYTEVITPDSFSVYRDGTLWEGFHEYAPSGQWENIYGFVPVVHAKHKDVGLDFGATPFNEFTSKIDEINDAASILNDQIRKAVNVMWYFAGVAGPDELSAGNQDKDAMKALYGPAGSEAQAMIADINIEHAGANIMSMLSELEADMPELALHRMRKDLGNISGIGISHLYDDAASRITEAQSNYDAPLIRAMQMGISIGAQGRYDGFTAFNQRSYERGDISLMIKQRPPLRDTLSKLDRMNLLLQTGAPPQAIWTELEYGDKVNEWTAWLTDPEAMLAQQIEAAN